MVASNLISAIMQWKISSDPWQLSGCLVNVAIMLGGSNICPKLAFPLTRLEDPPERSQDPRYNRRRWYSCSFWRVHGSWKLCSPHWNGHCPKTPMTGYKLLCSSLPSKFSSRATRGVGGNLWDEAMSSLPHSCKPRGTTHSSARCEGAEEEGVAFRGCLRPGQGPGAPPQRYLFPVASGTIWSPWTTQPSLLTALFPPRPGHFSLTCTKLSRICPSRDCGAAWHTQATPCENMGSDSDLSAFVHHAQTSMVPSLLAGQLLSWVPLYHLQQFMILRYPPHWAPKVALSLCSQEPQTWSQACLPALSA